MQDMIIQYRTEEESHPEDCKMYAVMFEAASKYALSLNDSGNLDELEVIGISVRAMQQLAANATEIANSLGVNLELNKEKKDD